MKIPPPPQTPFVPLEKLPQARERSLAPRAVTSLRHSRRMLRVLLAFLALLPVGLLLYGLLQEQNATRMVVDANCSGSLRYKSLWIYAVTNGHGWQKNASWHAVRADMATIRRDLRCEYPGPIARTDAAWANFDAQLQRTGSVDWPTADAAFNLAGICQNMEAAPLSPHRTITASVGAATCTPAMTGPTDLLDASDHALYFGKKRRNCAVHIESIHEIANIAVEMVS